MLQLHLIVGLFLLSDLFLKGLTSIVGGPSMLNVSVGKTLCVKCQYREDYHDYIKYWCKGSNWDDCKYVVKTDGNEEEKRVGRNVIKDNWTQAEFTVRMENITMEDTDVYWCAIEQTGRDIKWEVNIMVTIELPPTTMASTGYFSTSSAFPTETTGRLSNSDPDLMLLLPMILGFLVLILGGATLLMWKLKKKKATQNSKGLLPSTVSPSSDQATDGTELAYTTVIPTPSFASKSQVSPSSDQATDGTELAYTTVIPTPSFASKSQVSENNQQVDYASFRFSTLNDQSIYANT